MKIAAYCRVSTDKDEQLDSLENQKEFFTEYASKNGHVLFRVYADEGISGMQLKKRTEFKRLMLDAEAGLFEAVVVKDVSRLARNTVDFLQSIRKLKAMGINVIFVNANMDSLGESEFILTIFGAMAQEESGNLSKRVKWGKQINSKKGRVPPRIYGYDRIDNFTLQINQEEARVINEIFHLYVDKGLGCRRISIILNEKGYRTKFDFAWDQGKVQRIITNPIYCGHYVNNKYVIEDFLTGHQVKRPVEENYHHDRPEWAIITEELFNRTQEILGQRRVQYNSGEPFRGARYSSKHIFSTLIKCEHCGRSFCRKSYTYVNTRTYWKCTTNDQHTSQHCDNYVKIEEEDLLQHIEEYLSALISDKAAFVADVLKSIQYELPENRDAEVSAIKGQRAKLIKKKEKYQEMYANDLITMTELKSKLNGIKTELTALDIDEERISQIISVQENANTLVRKYTDDIEHFLAMEDVTNVDLRKIIDHISVNRNGNVRIILKKFDK